MARRPTTPDLTASYSVLECAIYVVLTGLLVFAMGAAYELWAVSL